MAAITRNSHCSTKPCRLSRPLKFLHQSSWLLWRCQPGSAFSRQQYQASLLAMRSTRMARSVQLKMGQIGFIRCLTSRPCAAWGGGSRTTLGSQASSACLLSRAPSPLQKTRDHDSRACSNCISMPRADASAQRAQNHHGQVQGCNCASGAGCCEFTT